MSQDYSPSLVTKNLVFCGDAAMKSAAGPATLLYDKVNDNNGTMYNANCVDFDGTDDYVTYGDVTWLDGITVFSICCWLYQDGSPPGTGGVFLSKDNAIECWTKQSSTDQYILSINNNHQIFSGASTPATGEWVHVVMTWNSTGDVRKLYLNGALADTNTSGSQSGNSINNTAQGLAIGARAAANYEIDGKMADVKIFNAELSAANVKELYDDSKVIIPTKNDASGGFLSQSDLTLWAPLAEGVGYVAYDGSGYGRDGTYSATDWLTAQTGAPQLVEGYNRPMWFSNAGSDYVQVASDGSSTFANQSFTVAGWIYTSDASPSGDRVLFSYDYTSHSNPYYSIHVRLNGSTPGRLYFIWNDGTTAYDITKDSAFTDNTWHHYACTFTSGSQKIYIDGAEVASGTRADTITYYNQEVWIGKGNFGGYWDGLINETVVYNSVLSLAQVQVLAATGPNGGPLPPDPMSLSNSSNVVGYWRNDGNVTWTDRSANSNTGTVYGSPDALLFKQGYNGQKNVNTGRDNQGFPLLHQNNGAVGFNGSDDEVVIPHASVFDITAALTQEMWFKIDTFANSGGGSYPTLIAKNANNYRWYLQNTSYDLHSRFSGLDDLVTNTTFSTGQWYYAVLTKDSGGFTWYVDGVFDKEDSQTGAMSTNTDDYVIGNWNAGGARAFKGQIANARIYNRALTYAEIQQNYNAFKSRFGE